MTVEEQKRLESENPRKANRLLDKHLAAILSPEPCHVFTVQDEPIDLADEALEELARAREPGVYVRGRQLVRVVRDRTRRAPGFTRPDGAPVIEMLSADALRDRLARLGSWTTTRTGRKTMPPLWVVANLLSRGEWPLKHLVGVIEAPALRPDGTVICVPGFDPATSQLYEPSEKFPAVPLEPTQAERDDALAALLDPLKDFPFCDESDKAAAVAAILSIVGRPAIEGPVPLFAFRAPAPGTGKSLLADVVSIVGTGRPAARMIMPADKDDGEVRKRILAVALEGVPVILLDNVSRRLGSASLSAALTANTWKDRVLGLSKTAEAPLRAVWLATGNNLTFRGDLGRRVVPVDLDARVEHPEDRTTFSYPDLLAHVAHDRPRLVTAALTLLRAYHVADRAAHGKPRKGSFEAWDDLVRGACVWAGLADPDAGKERIRADADADLLAIGEALQACAKAFGEKKDFKAADAVKAAEEQAARQEYGLRDALRGIVTSRDRDGHSILDASHLGYALRSARGRIVGGVMFQAGGHPSCAEGKKPSGLWRVVSVGAAGTCGHKGDDSPAHPAFSHT